MKVLIISNSRSGSTNLMKSIASANDLKPIHEPFRTLSKPYKLIRPQNIDLGENVVVKTLINQSSLIQYKKIIPLYDNVILLSRKDTTKMAESLIGSIELARNNSELDKPWELPYYYNQVDYNTFKKVYDFILKSKKDLEILSSEIRIPIDYYEDIYLNKTGLNNSNIRVDKKYFDISLKLRKN